MPTEPKDSKWSLYQCHPASFEAPGKPPKECLLPTGCALWREQKLSGKGPRELNPRQPERVSSSKERTAVQGKTSRVREKESEGHCSCCYLEFSNEDRAASKATVLSALNTGVSYVPPDPPDCLLSNAKLCCTKIRIKAAKTTTSAMSRGSESTGGGGAGRRAWGGGGRVGVLTPESPASRQEVDAPCDEGGSEHPEARTWWPVLHMLCHSYTRKLGGRT